MCKFWLCMVFFGGAVSAAPLSEALVQGLRTGENPFSLRQTAMIAGGVETEKDLEVHMRSYQFFIEDLTLPERYNERSPEKQLKALKKQISPRMRTFNDATHGISRLVDEGLYSHVTAAFIIDDLLRVHELETQDLKLFEDFVTEPFLQRDDGYRLRVLAALFELKAIAALESDPEGAARSLEIADLLAPNFVFGEKITAPMVYNQARSFFESHKFQKAALLTMAGARRFPMIDAFQPLAYNVGIMILKESEQGAGFEEVITAARPLVPFMGELAADFAGALGVVRLNHAVSLYNEGDFEAAVRLAEDIQVVDDQAAKKRLLIGAYEALIAQRLKAERSDGVDTLMARLQAVDAVRAEQFKQSLQQVKVKQLSEAEAFEEALAEAKQALDEEVGQQNYKAVVHQYVRNLSNRGHFKEALAQLDKVPESLRGEDLNDLRHYIYGNWAASLPTESYEARGEVFETLFADPALGFNSEDERAIYEEEYGDVLYGQIEKLIAEKQFQEADAQASAALKKLPNHPLLLEIKAKTQLILNRIK